MKLHVDKKKRGAIRKYLSILLVVCIVLSNGSTYVAASAGGEDGHQHVDGCYGRLAVCELAEHGDDCYQERLVCGQDGSDGHAHDGNCYGEVSMAGCGMEEHNEGCYKKVLACGYGDGTYDVAAFSETEGVQEAVDSEENGSDGATVEDMPQATDGQEPAEAGDGDGAGDMDEPEADVPSGGSVATEPEETGTPEESAGLFQLLMKTDAFG